MKRREHALICGLCLAFGIDDLGMHHWVWACIGLGLAAVNAWFAYMPAELRAMKTKKGE